MHTVTVKLIKNINGPESTQEILWAGVYRNERDPLAKNKAINAYLDAVRNWIGRTVNGEELANILNKGSLLVWIDTETVVLVSLVYDPVKVNLYNRLRPGTQILYVPDHAKGNLSHQDVEKGFVEFIRPELGMAFCRYYSKYDEKELRTKANAERSPIRNIVIKDHRPQNEVDDELLKIVEEKYSQTDP